MDDLSQEEEEEYEKIIEESNQMIVDMLKIINGKHFTSITDALARTISMAICNAVLSNIIDMSQREKVIDNIGKSAKLYLVPDETVKNVNQY